MNADRLREAARVLRKRANETATYIATMHPGVALALSDWLDEEADEMQYGFSGDFDTPARALAVADQILGGES